MITAALKRSRIVLVLERALIHRHGTKNKGRRLTDCSIIGEDSVVIPKQRRQVALCVMALEGDAGTQSIGHIGGGGVSSTTPPTPLTQSPGRDASAPLPTGEAKEGSKSRAEKR